MTNLQTTNTGFFRKLLLLTIVAIYLVILAGGIVRSTGSGMGCPDWPHCFGQWVPPTDASQLPANYQQIYGAKLKGEVVFNAYKTWVEYANRLVGVVSGLLIFATFIFSFRFLRSDKIVFVACLVDLFLMGFQGWLGSRVVAAELAPWIVTLHMLLAILIVFILFYILRRIDSPILNENLNVKKGNVLITVLLVLTLIQILLGTQVREVMDDVIARVGYERRDLWIDGMDFKFYIHRSFSIVLLLLQVALWRNIKLSGVDDLQKLSNWLLIVVLLEILMGVVMAYFNVPAFAQPIHLTLSIILVGLQFLIWLGYNPRMIWR
ncbi:MAG: COX15/CtaA family protein [Sediminibacterium sp.]|nr:COX15/CtaA family protein [Sediminibacterium sp.]